MSSAHNPVRQLNELHKSYMEGKLDRRTLLARAATLGLTSYALTSYTRGILASAQEATPATVVLPGGFKSMTREEYKAQLAADYPFTSADTERPQGGLAILGDISSSNLTTVNPMFANNFPTQDIVFQIFEQVVGLYPKGGAVFVPQLADSYEIAEDGKTYTFHLNPNATFHDGTPATAHDLEFTCDTVKNEASGIQYTQSFNDTIGSYRAVDDHTFEVVTSDVMAQIVFFPNFFAPVIARHVWESVPVENWLSDPGSTGQDPSRVVGTGPFKFDSISESEGISTFVRNDSYYDVVPAVEKFIFQVWPDDTAVVEALKAEQLDVYVANVPPSDVESLQAEENLDVAIYDTYQVSWYGYNLDPNKTPLFQQKEVRQALIHGIDRQSIVDNILLGFATVAIGSQPVLSEAFAPESITNKYEYDPTKAGQLLDAAGWVVGSDGIREKDGTKLSFQITYGSGSASSDQTVAAFQDNWKAIGVDAQPNSVDFDTVMMPALTSSFDFQVIFLGFDWASPSGSQEAMFGTEYKGAGFNAMGYSNAQYDELSAQANRELDPEKRREILIQATNIANDDAPACTLWFAKRRIAYNVKVQNYVPTANGLLWSLPYIVVQG
jgi:peptide/nickel transport system substrate-binding protein